MIRYELRCPEGHVFESWFRDSAAFDALQAQGALSCAICGAPGVVKTLMAPSLGKSAAPAEPAAPKAPKAPSGTGTVDLAALRRQVEESSEYVGRRFAAEARGIHRGEAEARSIWGEATRDEARELLEEGAPVAPLPFARRDD